MDCYANLPDGRVMIADGLNPPKVWDGLKAAPVDAGLPAPAAAVTLAAEAVPTAGNIIGTYTVYVRYVDDLAQPSDLSPVSNTLAALSAGGSLTIAGLTKSSPIRMTTSGAHGLTTGDRIQIKDATVPEWNGIYTVTRLSATVVSFDDTDGRDFDTYNSTGAAYKGLSKLVATVDLSDAPPKAVKWQLLRNTDGQADTYYVDQEGTSFAVTSIETTKTDATLATGEAVVLFDPEDDLPLANAHGVPPDYKKALVQHSGRLFMAVDEPYNEGAVRTVNGTARVFGLGVDWKANWVGRFLWVDGATQAHEITGVVLTGEGAPYLDLAEGYTGATAPYALYEIRPASGTRRLIYYSEPDQPESVPVFNALSLQENGDEISGLLTLGSFVYFLEGRHMHRFTFQSKPSTDGFVFQAAERGCVNQQSWVKVEGAAYMLDRAGVHKFTGGKSEPVSTQVQGLFTNTDDSSFRINWNASKYFHAAHFPDEECIRWFVSLGGLDRPRHAVCYHTRLDTWWLEAFPFAITASTLGTLQGFSQVFAGGEGKKVWAVENGELDGIRDGKGTLRGTVTSADCLSLTDSSASFDAGVVGLPVYIVAGRGKLQGRTIHAASGGRLKVDRPWAVKPDTTSSYQIGGVPYLYRSGAFALVLQDGETKRAVAWYFRPTLHADNLYCRVYLDEETAAVKFTNDHNATQYTGAGCSLRGTELVVPMNTAEGYAEQALDFRKARGMRGARSFWLEMEGVAGSSGAVISTIDLQGVDPGGV